MPVSLSIKNVPDETAEALKLRAKSNHRSLQGELRAILESAAARGPKLTAAEVYAEVRRERISTPSSSTEIIRAARDAR
ncbi:MAG: Arc family DNA-binding protein [Rhodospirillaceae bacterium]|nr:Arc family DNA-binding protein [Rhodospirillaceae bacterium]MBT3886799.1 Arc family DNA-binding protein [Rhodospirillaceae bacterium]MBT4117906.1 Arc family DNA-binding protein [Rhodospirillaceae bacterium]MBT4717975.1 Arc family DNA-binding protein [Rhodospirillaceae bacterium]MBT4748041.1 Arc family DNA-binding protein [Rhodospirillaceae bacterium]